MNKIPMLEKFAAQSLVYVDTGLSDGKELIFSKEKFAELIVQEHIDLLKQEWYALNNEPAVPGESPRDVGFRVGRKTEIINLIEKIKKHFNQA